MPLSGGLCAARLLSQHFIRPLPRLSLQRIDNPLQFTLCARPDVQEAEAQTRRDDRFILLSTTLRSLMAISCASK